MEKQLQILQHKIEHPPAQVPQKQDFYTVYPWVCLYKKLAAGLYFLPTFLPAR